MLKLYFLFWLLGATFYCFVFRHDHSLAVNVAGRLRSLVFASASHHDSRDLYPMAMWFFPGLISGLLITFAAWKIPYPWARWLVLSAVATAGFQMTDWALPWELESGCLAAGFLALGHGARLADCNAFVRRARRPAALLVAAAALLLGSWLAVLNINGLDIGMARLGNPLLAIPACALLLMAFATFAMNLPALKISEAVAAATILIFPTHQLLFQYFDRIAATLHLATASTAAYPSCYAWAKAATIVAATTLVHSACRRANSLRHTAAP